jgi:ATP-dependent Clp protease ATP-binding subunit ClpC
MFERYTEKAVKVIMLSQEESRRLGHNFVGTEQILLGLIGEETGIAAKVLRSMGVNLKDARIEVEKIVGRGSGFVALEIPFTPGAKRVLEFAQSESKELGHNYIGTEHLLLGLIDESENKAVRVMETLGVDLTKVRPQVVRMLGETTEVISESPSSPMTIQQIEMLLLLKSIETKTVAITYGRPKVNDRAVDELKKDIAALRRCIT